MSQTVSRGTTDVSKWTAVTAKVAAYLKGELDIPKGALFAIEGFFQAALAGALEKIPQPMPSMEAICCFSIATNVLTALRLRGNKKKGLTQKMVQERMAQYLKVIQGLKEKKLNRVELSSRNTDIESLIRFLNEMQEQGNAERHSRAASYSM